MKKVNSQFYAFENHKTPEKFFKSLKLMNIFYLVLELLNILKIFNSYFNNYFNKLCSNL